MLQNLSSAAFVIGALRVNIYKKIDHPAFIVCIFMENSIGLKWFSKKEKQDQTLLWTCVAGAHHQCVNNHYANFNYKGMKSV